jgi:putative ABC transport system permease protein
MSNPDSSGSRQSRPFEPRAMWISHVTSGLISDVRQALRQFRKSKGFVAATLATLALCIGTTTAIFSIVYSLMLKPLPFDEPERIVELYNSAVKAGLNRMPSNVVQYLDYSANSTSYETLGLWSQGEAMLGEDGSLERLRGARATAEIFDLLRVQPVLGQFFTKQHNRPGEDKVVVLTRSYWESKFAWDPEVIGKTVRLDGEAMTVIGVAPQVLEAFDARVKFIRPLSWSPQQEAPGSRYGLSIQLFGRLKPGSSIEQADAEAKTIEKRYFDASPPPTRQFIERSGITVNVGGVQAQRVGPVKTTLYLLQGGVAFVLLIGCVNVANLLLVRSNARQSELAIRFALGASRGVIARQLLVESLLLTGVGALLGIVVAWGALRGINHFTREMLPQALPMALDMRVLGFAIGLSVVVGLFIGLIPIVHLLRTNLTELIHRSSRGASAGRGVRSLSSLLVIGQVAVALVLLTGAGLLIHGFIKALNVDPGFDPRGVVGAGITLPAAHRGSDEAARAVQDRILQALEEIPGVTASTLSYSTPFKGGVGINALTLAEDPLPPGSPQPGAYRVTVTPGYFDTMKLRLVEGRFFERGDLAPGPPRYVVDETFAKKFFPNRSAIGGRFVFGRPPEKDSDWPTVIGVVRDVPHNGVEEKSGNPFIYQLLQGRPGGFGVYVRSERPVGDTVSAMRAKIREIDPTITMLDGRALEAAMDESYDTRRAVMLLMAAFAAIALFLSALGIFGVLAYDVSQRTREIGIRGAIGATRGQVIELIMKQGLRKAVIGLVVGLVGAWLVSRTMTSLLFQVTPSDPIVYASVSMLLLLVAALASYLPARRAARIDPMVALRVE